MELLPFCSILLFSFLASSVSDTARKIIFSELEISFLSFNGGLFGCRSWNFFFVGVNYGRVTNNLPPATKVVELLKSNDIGHVKLYDADPSVLRALAGSDIKVVVTVPNELLASVVAHPGFALQWVQRNVATYYPSTQIHSIAVGNEVFVFPRNITNFLVPTMQNVHTAHARLHLYADVKISSPIALTTLPNSYPSSAGSFRPELVEMVIRPMLEFLRETGSYLMIKCLPSIGCEPLHFQGKEEDEEEMETRATGGDRESEGEKTAEENIFKKSITERTTMVNAEESSSSDVSDMLLPYPKLKDQNDKIKEKA
ncbi:lichenase-like [Curcuma longa]